MIAKVSLYFVLPMMFIAFFLAILGVQHIELGDSYYTFIASVGTSFENWKLQIPDIPKIPLVMSQSSDTAGLILVVFIKFVNFLVRFVNVIISILNILVSIINILIQLIQFILTVIYQCKDFIGRVAHVS